MWRRGLVTWRRGPVQVRRDHEQLVAEKTRLEQELASANASVTGLRQKLVKVGLLPMRTGCNHPESLPFVRAPGGGWATRHTSRPTLLGPQKKA